MNKDIPFYKHDLGEAEVAEIRKVINGRILTTGDYVKEFESRFAVYLGTQSVICCSSCTGAAHIAFLGLGLKPGDEVITTPMTFIATATAIIQAGGVPVFVDVEADTGNLDAANVEAAITPHTKAIMPVHLYGQMCDMRALRSIADKHGLFIVEDAAHCIEGERDGVRPGQLGDAACFSFFATKNLACGEGGAVTLNDTNVADQIRLLSLHGMTKTSADRDREGYQHWDMVCMGWKYNMDNIHGAILQVQLQGLEQRWKRRQYLADLYQSMLKDIRGITWPRRLSGIKHANHLFPVWVDSAHRDVVIDEMAKRGVPCVVNYRAIHLLTYFKSRLGVGRGMFPVAERIGDSTISLPFYCSMTEADVEYVTTQLRQILS